MKKPYIICHMMTSIDGRIDCAMTSKFRGVNEYYQTLEELDVPTTVSGRVTAELEMAEPGEYVPKDTTAYGKEGFSKKTEAAGYEIVVDSRGRLLWPRSEGEAKPYLILTAIGVAKEYLEEENGDLTEALHKAGNWGTVEVYEYLGDGQYGIIPLWSQEFAIAHAGNTQIFLTEKDGYDYLVVTSLWTGQGVCYYDYNVLSPRDYCFDRYHNELKGADHYAPQFFTGLENWLKEDSLLLVATDIDMPQGQEVILTTDEETHYANEYLKIKKERQQRIEDIE